MSVTGSSIASTDSQSSIVSFDNTINDLQVESTNNNRVNHSRLTKLFIGTVSNRGNQLTTNELSEKAKSAKIASIVAMAVGIVLCIVATALIAGVGLPFIPMAAIFAFGLAACLYGTVLGAVAVQIMTDIDNATRQDIDKTSLQEIERQDDTSDGSRVSVDESLQVSNWFIDHAININDLDSVHLANYQMTKITCDQLLELTDYDLNTIPAHTYIVIAKRIDSLLKDKDVSPADKRKLIDFTKTFLDALKESDNPSLMDGMMQTYNLLIAHLENVKMEKLPLPWPKVTEAEPVKLIETATTLNELQDVTRFELIETPETKVYIDRQNGTRYIPKILEDAGRQQLSSSL